MKNALFYYFKDLNFENKTGSYVRPPKMFMAFKNIGYELDLIDGESKKRKKMIHNVTKRIKNGFKYDFIYCEALTMPHFFSDNDHIPRNPFLDISFFKTTKMENIKLGIYYRDIHWRFSFYKEKVPFWKRLITIPAYYLELFLFLSVINCIFMPSKKMYDLFPIKNRNILVEDLPPGCELKSPSNNYYKIDKINLLYIGSIDPTTVYDITPMIKSVSGEKNIKLTVCCPEVQWVKFNQYYKSFIKNNVSIIHRSGEELGELFNNSHLFIFFVKNNDYKRIAMPIKIFEALGYGIPIITNNETEYGDFVLSNNIGWAISDINELKNLFNNILKDNNMLMEKRENALKVRLRHTWEERARKVQSIMEKLKK